MIRWRKISRAVVVVTAALVLWAFVIGGARAQDSNYFTFGARIQPCAGLNVGGFSDVVNICEFRGFLETNGLGLRVELDPGQGILDNWALYPYYVIPTFDLGEVLQIRVTPGVRAGRTNGEWTFGVYADVLINGTWFW